MKRLAILLFLVSPAFADTADDEIDYLLDSVAKSRCQFVRNGRVHSARTARAHLRSKNRRNAKYVSSADDFIVKIASQSATTGRPYLIRCRGQGDQPSGDWLRARLEEYRERGSDVRG